MRVRVAPAPLQERKISTPPSSDDRALQFGLTCLRDSGCRIRYFEIAEYIEVRYASGSELYATFAGEIENPEPREVIFADGLGRAHARRWSNRQSGYSAARDETTTVLIVAEAVHTSAHEDVQKLTAALANEIQLIWSATPKTAILNKFSPRFEF